MPSTIKTPGVYIQELDAFGNTVIPVPTAVPAFIGYTQKTSFNGKSLINKAVRITSLSEFLNIFGSDAPQVQYNITPASENSDPHAVFSIEGDAYSISRANVHYRMYSSLKFFYENGGGDCFVMSIGAYDYSIPAITDTNGFTKALTLLKKVEEPTILLIPDVVEVMDPTVNSSSANYLQNKYAKAYAIQSEMINHCGEMKNRFAILDIPGGYNEKEAHITSTESFRDNIEPALPEFNGYAAAYYPWLHTTVYQQAEINYSNINKNSYPIVLELLTKEFKDAKTACVDPKMRDLINAFSETPGMEPQKADAILQNLSISYRLLLSEIMADMNLIAPAAGMAGIYTTVDNNQGVWVAPANISIQSTISPSIKIDSATQEILNAPINGKSICAIRAFTGMGNLVWGARTLDGNSNDWRYINIRRTIIYIEQSIREAAKAYVFAPNDAGTWINVKSMISSFLTGLWKQGGLVGSTPTDAFSVHVGLGSTMTPEDILNGIMHVAVRVAVSHPAEFIEITFQQEMQKG